MDLTPFRIFLVLLMLCGGGIQLTSAASEEYRLDMRWGGPYDDVVHFSAPHHVAVDTSGYIYVIDGNSVQKCTLNATLVARWGASAIGVPYDFNGVNGIATDSAGNFYISDSSARRIAKFTSAGEFALQWGANGTGDAGLSGPRGIAVDQAGYVYVVDNWSVKKFTSTGTFVTAWGGRTFDGEAGRFYSPSNLAIDGAGFVYVLEDSDQAAIPDRMQKFSSSGAFIAAYPLDRTTIDDGYVHPEGIGASAAGDVYVTYTRRWVQKYSSSGVLVDEWATEGMGDGQFYWPTGVAVDTVGNVYIVDLDNRGQTFTPDGTFIARWGSAEGGWRDGEFQNPCGIAVDGADNVFVADSDNHRIQKFSSNGAFVTKWGTWGSGRYLDGDYVPASPGLFAYPYGVEVDSAGYVSVADRGNGIQKFTSTGWFVTKWGDNPSLANGSFDWPYAVAIDSDGYVYVADYNQARVQKFTSSGTFVTTWGTPGSENGQFADPQGIAVDSAGNVYVTDANRVQMFTSTGTFLTTWGSEGSGNGQFNEPWGITVDRAGFVYVADCYNYRVQKFTPDGTFITAIGTRESSSVSDERPTDVAVDCAGNVYVATSSSYVLKFRPNGTVVGVVPGGAGAPTDTDSDGTYDDVNGNGRADFADVVLYFNQLSWIAANEPVAAFDYNNNGRIDFADVVWLSNNL